jgi:hypothetical protein
MGFFQWFQSKPKSKDLTEDITAKYEGDDLDDLFPFPDEDFLEDLGADEIDEIITQMLQDDQVSAEFETFKSFIGNSNHIIQPPDEKDTELSEAYANYLTRDGGRLTIQINNFYEALEFGSVICRVDWKDPAEVNKSNSDPVTDDVWVIDRLKPLDHSLYGFNKRGEMVERLSGRVITEDRPYRFVSVSHDVRGGNLNGNSLLLKAYWPWKFRKACITAGLLYVKKAVIPSIVAIYKAAKNKTDNAERGALIAKELSKLANSSGIALTNIEDFETVDPTSKGQDIIDLTEMFNRMISKALLGISTLTNEARFSANDTADTSKEIIQDRAEKVAVQEFQPAINTLLKWTAELNKGDIPVDKLPLFKFIYEYDPSFDEVMKATTNGILISGKWFYEKFNIKPPEKDNEDDILVKPVAPIVPPVNASTNDNGFFLHSRHPRSKPPMTKTISKILSSITAKR